MIYRIRTLNSFEKNIEKIKKQIYIEHSSNKVLTRCEFCSLCVNTLII